MKAFDEETLRVIIPFEKTFIIYHSFQILYFLHLWVSPLEQILKDEDGEHLIKSKRFQDDGMRIMVENMGGESIGDAGVEDRVD